MHDIVVFGTGGFGREIMEELYQKNLITKEYNILGFIDDNKDLQGKAINGFTVIGTSEYIINSKQKINVLVCIGEPVSRKFVANKLSVNKNVLFPNFIARNVMFNERLTKIGVGNIVYCYAFLSTNVKLGDFNQVSLHCTLGHDTELKDFITISPTCNISGNVKIESCSYIGTKSAIREGVTIGENSIIGMGSIVVKDIENSVMAFGNPCKVQRKLSDGERVFK